MQPFRCGRCGQLVFFENSTCLQCGAALGFLPDVGDLVVVEADRSSGGYEGLRWCENWQAARCNWLLGADDPESLCRSCRLTTKRPNDDDPDAMAAFADAETAKRRLLAQVLRLGLPVVGRDEVPERGLAFELLASYDEQVITGHQGGVITLDLSESDPAHRVFVREQLGEPYRTVLGHFRHEFGHYVWLRLVEPTRVEAFRALFGDERVSYDEAKEQHYGSDGGAGGAGESWSGTHVSRYATMHPWEDWAETFAHYLHIEAGLATARGFGLSVGEPSTTAVAPSSGDRSIAPMIDAWLRLTLALNGMSRSIGQDDLYPFVLSDTVLDKLQFVHDVVSGPN